MNENPRGFEVTLIGPGKEFEEEIEKQKLHILDINERQKKAIEYLKEHKKITSSEYIKLFDVSERTARDDLRDLANKKVLTRRGTSKKTTYYTLTAI